MHDDPLCHLLAGLDTPTAEQARALHAGMLDVGITPQQAQDMLNRALAVRAQTIAPPQGT